MQDTAPSEIPHLFLSVFPFLFRNSIFMSVCSFVFCFQHVQDTAPWASGANRRLSHSSAVFPNVSVRLTFLYLFPMCQTTHVSLHLCLFVCFFARILLDATRRVPPPFCSVQVGARAGDCLHGRCRARSPRASATGNDPPYPLPLPRPTPLPLPPYP